MIVSWRNLPPNPLSDLDVLRQLEATNAWLRSASYEQAWLTNRIVSRVTLDADPTCGTAGVAAALTASGFDLRNTRSLFFLDNPIGCGVSTPYFGNVFAFWPSAATHEFGHTLGLVDAYGRYLDGTTTTDVQYAEPVSVMGAGGSASGPERLLLGWLTRTTITADGDYTLVPLTQPSGVRVLALQLPSVDPVYRASSLYLEYWPGLGVIVHTLTTALDLDAGPAVRWGFTVGQSLTVSGRTLTLVQQDASAAVMRLGTVAPDPEPAPQPPADTNAPTIALMVTQNGKSANYTVTIAATDNVGVVRSELLVDGKVTATFLSGWTGTIALKTKGLHTLDVRAWDAAGNRGTALKTVVR